MYTVHMLAASRLPLPPSRLFEPGVERHLRNALERARHGAAGLRLLGRPLKGGLVESGHLASHLELHARDRGRPTHHLQRAGGGGLHARGRLASFFEARRQRHAEAGGVGRRDQLLRVGALLALEARREAVGPAERAAAGFEASFAILELSFPRRRSLTGGHDLAPRWSVEPVIWRAAATSCSTRMISRKGGTAGRARAAASGSPRCRTSPRSPPACERQAGRLIASRRRRRGATGRSRSPIPTASRSRSSRSRAADASLRYRGHAGAADVRGRLIAVPRPPAAGSQPGAQCLRRAGPGLLAAAG